MYMYMYIYMYIHTCIHMYIYTCIYIHTHTHSHIHTHTHTHVRALLQHAAAQRPRAGKAGGQMIGPTCVCTCRYSANQVFGLAVPAILIYVVGFQLGKVRVPVAAHKRPLRVSGARWQVVVVYNVARSGKLQDPGMLAKYVPRVPP